MTFAEKRDWLVGSKTVNAHVRHGVSVSQPSSKYSDLNHITVVLFCQLIILVVVDSVLLCFISFFLFSLLKFFNPASWEIHEPGVHLCLDFVV